MTRESPRRNLRGLPALSLGYPPHMRTTSSAVGILRPSGLAAQQGRHTVPGNIVSASARLWHLVQTNVAMSYAASPNS